jgi:hypothetical protein
VQVGLHEKDGGGRAEHLDLFAQRTIRRVVVYLKSSGAVATIDGRHEVGR